MAGDVNSHYYSLRACGMVPSSITGPDAANAIADWQEAHGLVADGVIGPATADAMHLDAEARGAVTWHFSDAELLQGATLPAGWGDRLRRTKRMAEVLRRDAFGGVPVEVLGGGGFRLPGTSDGKGQARKSQHLEMRAVDLRPVQPGTGTPVADWFARINQMQTDGRLAPGGCKVYANEAKPFVHTDWRGYIARW
jgi:peptidoglycan hydrolase-like protein with peptidoglycan-binding domain